MTLLVEARELRWLSRLRTPIDPAIPELKTVPATANPHLTAALAATRVATRHTAQAAGRGDIMSEAGDATGCEA
jgi:hypothetical protein